MKVLLAFMRWAWARAGCAFAGHGPGAYMDGELQGQMWRIITRCATCGAKLTEERR